MLDAPTQPWEPSRRLAPLVGFIPCLEASPHGCGLASKTLWSLVSNTFTAPFLTAPLCTPSPPTPSPAISPGLLPQCLPSSVDLPLAASYAHVIPCHVSRSRV